MPRTKCNLVLSCFYRIFEIQVSKISQVLIGMARDLYAGEDFGLELNETVYALDASIIDLCLSLFSWARFRKTKAAIKLHTLLDLRGNIPSFISITEGKIHDVNILENCYQSRGLSILWIGDILILSASTFSTSSWHFL